MTRAELDQIWYTVTFAIELEFNQRGWLPPALTTASDAVAARYPLREALMRGFMKTSTSDGEHHITVSFETLEDMQEARKALYHAIRQTTSAVSSTHVAQAPSAAIVEEAMWMLQDVPGDTLIQRVAHLTKWYQDADERAKELATREDISKDSTLYVERSMVRVAVMGTGDEALLKYVDSFPIFVAADFLAPDWKQELATLRDALRPFCEADWYAMGNGKFEGKVSGQALDTAKALFSDWKQDQAAASPSPQPVTKASHD